MSKTKSSRPMWQLLVGFFVIAVVVYVAVYALYISKNVHMMYTATPSASPIQLSTLSNVPILLTRADAKKRVFFTSSTMMTVYTFNKDTTNTSHCTGACSKMWPPYLVTPTAGKIPPQVTSFQLPDGSKQYAYNGKPLYFYVLDVKPGDILGNGVGGNWHIATP